MRQTIVFYLLVLMFSLATTAQGGTKEELVRLQEDVNTLRSQLLEFEKNLNENNSGLKSLIEQLNDQVAKSNMLLNDVLVALEQDDSGKGSDNEDLLPEIQTLSRKIDEMVTGMSALARQVSDLQIQSQPFNRVISSEMSSADSTYSQAMHDLIEGNFDLSIQGFNAYLNFFPPGDKAALARYYIGENYYNMKLFPQAIEAFTSIIDEDVDSDKVASALYKRGKSYLEMGDKDMAAEDFRTAMERYPDSPEAALSKAELQVLGILSNTKKR